MASKIKLVTPPTQVPGAAEKIITTNKTTNKGGRKKKTTPKAENYTITMDPIRYNKFKTLANEYYEGNFSTLLKEALNCYLRVNNIDLANIAEDSEARRTYMAKVERRSARELSNK